MNDVRDEIEEYRQEIYELELELTDDEKTLAEREAIRQRIQEIFGWIWHLEPYEEK